MPLVLYLFRFLSEAMSEATVSVALTSTWASSTAASGSFAPGCAAGLRQRNLGASAPEALNSSWRMRHCALVHCGFGTSRYVGKKSVSALYPRNSETVPKLSRYLSVAWAKKPAVMPIVVGSDAAQTPSRLMAFSSPSSATTIGGAHWKQASSPGTSSWMCPDTAFSLTPLSIHVWPSSLHAWLTEMRAA